MILLLIELVFFALCALLVFLNLSRRPPPGLPPGEWGWPVVGYMPNRRERITAFAKRLRKKHGNIFCVKIGSRIFVFLTDYSTIKATLSRPEFSGRPDFFTFQIFRNFMNLGIIISNGSVWSTNRRFALRVLKDFGLGRSTLETFIKEETKFLIEDLLKTSGRPTTIDWNLNVTVLNVLWRLVAGRRYDTNDPEIHKFSKIVTEDFKYRDGPMEILNFLPWMEYYLPNLVKNKWMNIDKATANRDTILNYFSTIIQDHLKTIDRGNPRDFIDMYIIESEKDDELKQFHGKDNKYYDLSIIVDDLFAAGSETTSSTIRWFFSYMAKHRTIQQKIQAEIDAVVPKERFPSMNDKDNLPYFEASIYELHRIVSLVPSVPHSALEDATINNFRIPKDAVILPCAELCHKDRNYWKNPKQFYPEHFLDNNGKFQIPKEGFLPFSIGRRQCLGESLAKMELFLFCSAILQTFEIRDQEDDPVSLDPNPEFKIINHPKSSKFVLIKRDKDISSK